MTARSYTLDREDVESKLKGIPPKPVQKYAVALNGKLYPPKQVVAEALELPLITFTTMDASRAFATVGFEVKDMASGQAPHGTRV